MTHALANLPQFVIDTSAAAKWFLRDEDHVAEADYLGHLFVVERRISLTAPAFFHYEMPNVLRQAVRRGRMTLAVAHQHLTDFMALAVPLLPDEHLIDAAARLSFRYQRYTYDFLFAELAREQGVPLVTADEDFARSVANEGYDFLFSSASDFRTRVP